MTIAFISLLPILLYILVLKMFDSFALAKWKLLAGCFAAGLASCLIAFLLGRSSIGGIFDVTVGGREFSLMPILEELLKAVLPLILVCSRRIRFMAEALIYGAAAGGGFSLLENAVYLYYIPDMEVGTAIVRGFGCAILHIGCTALVATAALVLIGKKLSTARVALAFIPSLIIHLLYNNLQEYQVVSPMVMLVAIIVLFVVLLLILFGQGEKAIYKWMDHSISIDIQTRAAIMSGNFASTRAGEYLLSVKERFSPEDFFDMICYVQLFLEIKIEKQSIMLLKQAGFDDDSMGIDLKEHEAKKAEMESIEKRVGRTAMWVLAPLVKDEVHQ